MLLELFPFVILNGFCIYAYFFSDFLSFEMSLLLLTVTLRGVSNKHCLLYFSLLLYRLFIQSMILYCSDCLEHLWHNQRIMKYKSQRPSFILGSNTGFLLNHNPKAPYC